ncbi:hypothetical protein [Paenibacillus xylanilyticus]|uniref:Uncharacterized protein n=1 Tax=Paenibacillus xylanilyticus TaxID=248903 RepID=A0A7Y6BU76_9BACL|nr:hypothetical protein [Paenibacillus xylanilyticus]NUU74255.1 hypothetical protein [Paenibacillus xylanilyticus]
MQPGEGAIEYAAEITAGLPRSAAAIVIRRAMTEPSADPRIKDCEVCRYPFRDKTKNRSATVCGPWCKTTKKSAQRKQQRKKVKRVHNVTVKPSKPIRYLFWLEYPFWLKEKWMIGYAGSYERPRDPDKLAQITAAKQRTELMGGKRRRKTEIIEY